MTSRSNPASIARCFVGFNRAGVLSTLSKAMEGMPFGSIAPYDVDRSGSIVIFISRLSEHYKNLVVDPRASLCIPDCFGFDNPQAHTRATLVGRFTEVSEAELDVVNESYSRRFPDALPKEIAGDFKYFRMIPERVRWIAGFGEIRWISASDYLGAAYDAVSYVGYGIVAHMNADHRDALVAYLGHYTNETESGTTAAGEPRVRMVFISGESFVLEETGQDRHERHSIAFPGAVTSADNVRRSLISMLAECRREPGADHVE